MPTVFTPSFSVTQSANGTLLTFTDLSNWIDNTNGYVKANFDRTFNVVDAYGQVFATLMLNDIVDVVTFPITKNMCLVTTFNIDGTVDFAPIQKQLFDRFTAIAYRDAINEGKCCGNANSLSNVTMANIFLQGVDFAVPIGNGVDVQKFEDAAYKYLTA